MDFDNARPLVISRFVLPIVILALGLGACSDDAPPPTPRPKVAPPAAPAAPRADAAPAPVAKPAAPAANTADRSLAARVKDALLAEKALNAHGIEVDARDGVVTLFGTVENKARREQAAKIAARVEGARSVENKLVVVAGS